VGAWAIYDRSPRENQQGASWPFPWRSACKKCVLFWITLGAHPFCACYRDFVTLLKTFSLHDGKTFPHATTWHGCRRARFKQNSGAWKIRLQCLNKPKPSQRRPAKFPQSAPKYHNSSETASMLMSHDSWSRAVHSGNL
jgi:hypothetical protein